MIAYALWRPDVWRDNFFVGVSLEQFRKRNKFERPILLLMHSTDDVAEFRGICIRTFHEAQIGVHSRIQQRLEILGCFYRDHTVLSKRVQLPDYQALSHRRWLVGKRCLAAPNKARFVIHPPRFILRRMSTIPGTTLGCLHSCARTHSVGHCLGVQFPRSSDLFRWICTGSTHR